MSVVLVEQENLKKIASFLDVKGITSNEREMWKQFCEQASDDECELLYRIFQNEKLLLFLTGNLTEKMRALRSDDQVAMADIYKKEEAFVASLDV